MSSDASGGFAQRAHDALGNRQLHIALDRTTAQLGMRRSTAVASLENFEAVRDQARAAKMQVLRTLGDSLRRFEEQLIAQRRTRALGRHRCRRQPIIVDIATRTGVAPRREEQVDGVGGNAPERRAREGRHRRDRDRPRRVHRAARQRSAVAHHRADHAHDAEQVGRADARTAVGPLQRRHPDARASARATAPRGVPAAPTWASAARTSASSRTGRSASSPTKATAGMVTTLPRIHVALMGIEKLVPTMADLDRCLKLLARRRPARSSPSTRRSSAARAAPATSAGRKNCTSCCSTTAAPRCSPARRPRSSAASAAARV